MAFYIPGALAVSTATAAYLDAKYHISKDIREIRATENGLRKLERAKANKEINILSTLTSHAARHPDGDFIWTPTGTYSWATTLSMTRRFARWFAAAPNNVRRGDAVGLYLQNSAEFMFAWLGLAALGAHAAMLNYHLAGEALAHGVRVARARVVLVDAELTARVDEACAQKLKGLDAVNFVVVSEELMREVAALDGSELPKEMTEGIGDTDTLALRYTSGTTGFPKAVRSPVLRSYNFAVGKFASLGVKPGPDGDRWYVCMPVCHATAGSLAMASMVMGVTICLVKRFSVTNFWSDVRECKATMFVYVGEVCRYLLAAPPSPLDKEHNIRLIYGNGLRPDVWPRFRDRFGIPVIAELFGSTESMVTFVNPARGDFLAGSIGHHGAIQRWQQRNAYTTVAIDYETGEIRRDPNTKLAICTPLEEGGEMLVAIASTAAFAGYIDNAKATASKFVRNVRKPGDLYYRTGDALRRDREGRWFFVDRLGDTFRWRSENVSTAEVSVVLGRYPGIVDANVVGVTVPGHEGRAGCAALLLEQPNIDLDGFLRHAQKDLPKYAIPVFLRIVKEPDMNNTHKQSKTKIRDEGVDPDKTRGDTMYVLLDNSYVPFTREHWGRLGTSSLKL